MQLTYYRDYSLRVLMYLAVNRQRLVNISEIADRDGILRNHLVKVVHNLARGDFIKSYRGKGGGIELARDPAKINIGEVLRYTEGPLKPVECFDAERNRCVIANACGLAEASPAGWGNPASTPVNIIDIWLEMAWTIIPAIVVVLITVPTVRTIIQTQPDRWPPDTLEVRVIAHQWWWEFRYPQSGVITADEAHIPIHRTIHFSMVSRDVIHSFFMPAIGGKRDVVPGQTNSITLTANKVGEYWGRCTEFCGDSHANMRFRVFVDTPEGFAAWTKHQLSGPVRSEEGPAAGAKIFADAPCAICHTIRGVTGFSKEYTFGFRGPDLTHFASRGTMAGAILDNTPENVARWITNPDALKPGANMPTLGLQGHSEDLNELVAYLVSLK